MRLKEKMPAPPKRAGFFKYVVACGWQGKDWAVVYAKNEKDAGAALLLFHPGYFFSHVISKESV